MTWIASSSTRNREILQAAKVEFMDTPTLESCAYDHILDPGVAWLSMHYKDGII